ncbi:MAG TPA: hypothetical protein VMS75_12310 [Terriglobales bacterium]|nr:hypothetical protein [Terriglobales bacterium]
MKKVVLGLLAVGLLACGLFAQAPEKKWAFSINLGVQTNLWRGSSFDEAQGTVDLRAGYRIGKSFEISPEVMYATGYKFHTDFGFLYPGVMLNYLARNFFVGAGAVIPVAFGQGSSSSGNPAPKINVGYIGDHFILTAYMIMYTESDPSGYWSFPHFNFVGASLGYRF